MSDFAPDSIEARVADATSQFGLQFIQQLGAGSDTKENVVISPISLQNLLNMVLFGAKDASVSQLELIKVLGYDKTNLLSANSSASDRVKPHEAMRSVFQSILTATHLGLGQASKGDLLNTNAESLEPGANIAAHLQTSIKEADTPLSGQLNFTMANLMLTNRDLMELRPEYEADLRNYYNVIVEQFSKSSSSSAAASANSDKPLHERINSWVRNVTNNQIEKLADAADFNQQDLMMVLLNAAHFKGRWLQTFDPKATHERSFFNLGRDDSPAQAMFMRRKGVFGYAEFGSAVAQADLYGSDTKTRSSEDSETLLTEDNSKSADKAAAQPMQPPTVELSKEETRRYELTSSLNCSAIMLPFSLNEGQELSMIILLPVARDGLAQLQASLSPATLNEIYKSLSEQQVQVELPKFSFETSLDAKSLLLQMGLKSIFEESSDLERMYTGKTGAAHSKQVKLDKIIHKSKIVVDETGAEAAAASMATIVMRNFFRPPLTLFVADHPFMFVIRHNRSNMPLFMGTVNSL